MVILGKREENKKRKQEAILQAALENFSVKGYGATSISEIAMAAGIGKGTVYDYYPSKDELFFAVFEWYMASLVSASMIEASQLKGDAADRLQTFLFSALRAGCKQIDYFGVVLEFWAAAGNPVLRDRFRSSILAMYDAMRTPLAELIAEGKRADIFHAQVNEYSVAAALVGAIDGLMLQGWMDRDFDVEAAARDLFDTLMEGMLSPDRSLP